METPVHYEVSKSSNNHVEPENHVDENEKQQDRQEVIAPLDTLDLVDKIEKAEAASQKKIQQAEALIKQLKEQLANQNTAKTERESVKKEAQEVVEYLYKNLDIKVDVEDPTVHILVYIRHAIAEELGKESERRDEFIKKFDERLVKAEAFHEGLDKHQAQFLQRITEEHYTQRAITADTLTKHINGAVTQGIEKLKAVSAEEPKESKMMTYMMYALLGLSVINLLI